MRLILLGLCLMTASVMPLVVSFTAHAADEDNCLASANTQLAMNRCHGVTLNNANTELKSVLTAIHTAYQTKPEFLAKLSASQHAWQQSLQADLAMKFPLADKQQKYGSVYPMCASGFATRLTLQRIELLKQWLIGVQEGEVCSGSVMNRRFVANKQTEDN